MSERITLRVRLLLSAVWVIALVAIGLYLGYGWLTGTLPSDFAHAVDTHTAAGEKAYQEERYSDAEGHFRAALHAVDSGGFGAAYRHDILYWLALVHAQTDRLEEAESLVREALAIVETKGDQDRNVTARYYHLLGGLRQRRECYAEAATHYERARILFEPSTDSSKRDFLQMLRNYAVVQKALGRSEEAERLDAQRSAAEQGKPWTPQTRPSRTIGLAMDPKYFRLANPRNYILEKTADAPLKIHDGVLDLKSQDDRSTYLECEHSEGVEFTYTAEVVGTDNLVSMSIQHRRQGDEVWVDINAASGVRIETLRTELPAGMARFHVRFAETSSGGLVRLKLVVRRPPA